MQIKSEFNTFRFSFFVLLFLVLILVPPDKALAQEPTPSDDAVNAIAKQLYCPVCENTPLDVCPTEACRQWRELIRSQLADGWTEDQIKQYFVDNYGDRVLAEPPRTGLNWAVYILPPVIILLGAFILFRALRAWTKPSTASAGPGASGASAPREAKPIQQDDYVARFEEELKKRK
jgi:cytochrome c-type biogenesis protein CcmH